MRTLIVSLPKRFKRFVERFIIAQLFAIALLSFPLAIFGLPVIIACGFTALTSGFTEAFEDFTKAFPKFPEFMFQPLLFFYVVMSSWIFVMLCPLRSLITMKSVLSAA